MSTPRQRTTKCVHASTRVNRLGRLYCPDCVRGGVKKASAVAASRQVRKTHCPKGHEYTPENTIWAARNNRPNPTRRCRACHRAGTARAPSAGPKRAERAAARERQRQEDEWYDWAAVYCALNGLKIPRELTKAELAGVMRQSGGLTERDLADRLRRSGGRPDATARWVNDNRHRLA